MSIGKTSMQRSEKQRETSRQNGLNSRGPVSPGAKRNSHGLFASLILIDGDSLIAERQPESPTEFALVQKLAASHWRLQRAWAIRGSRLLPRNETPRRRVPQRVPQLPRQPRLLHPRQHSYSDATRHVQKTPPARPHESLPAYFRSRKLPRPGRTPASQGQKKRGDNQIPGICRKQTT